MLKIMQFSAELYSDLLWIRIAHNVGDTRMFSDDCYFLKQAFTLILIISEYD